jgi:hypothetical protein
MATPTTHRSSNSALAVQRRSYASVTWAPSAAQLAVDHSGPPVLLSLLLSVAILGPVPDGKITLLIVTERHLTRLPRSPVGAAP